MFHHRLIRTIAIAGIGAASLAGLGAVAGASAPPADSAAMTGLIGPLCADVPTANATVFLIDTVLMPPAA